MTFGKINQAFYCKVSGGDYWNYYSNRNLQYKDLIYKTNLRRVNRMILLTSPARKTEILSVIPICQNMTLGRFITGVFLRSEPMWSRGKNSWARRNFFNGASQVASNELRPAKPRGITSWVQVILDLIHEWQTALIEFALLR